MANINVNTVKLRECGHDVMRLSNELNDVLTALFNRINNVPVNTKEWTGKAAQDYVRKLNEERKRYNELKNNLYNYGKVLYNSADKMESVIRGNTL